MQQTAIGNSDLKAGPIAYGCWRLAEGDAASAREKVRTALDAGLTLIDTADIYGLGETCGFGGCEKLLGEILAAEPVMRSRMVLATKGGIIPPRPYNSSYDYLIDAMDASLRRLRTDYVDLYQIHRPDLTTPFSETAWALNALIAAGKARYVGVSNFTAAQTRALQAHLDAPLITTQPEFSALRQDPMTDGTLDWCSETGATALAWSPLAGGALATGKTDHPRGAAVNAAIERLAETHNTDRSTIALAFTMHHGAHVIPIIGTQDTKRIQDAARAAEIRLEAREFYDIVEAYRGERMP